VRSLPAILTIAHLVGLALALGAATVKLVLLLRCRADGELVQAFLKVARPITRLIVAGMILLALSGIGWLLVAYDLTPLLIVKLALFGSVFVLGPIIDNIAEPKFRTLAPAAGEPPSPEFLRARQQYVALEVAATLLFYVIVVLWVMAS
jgi:hypothetical protein